MAPYPKSVTCPVCRGTGRVPMYHVPESQDVYHIVDRCPACNGTGRTGTAPETSTCTTCQGKGLLDPTCDYCGGLGGRIVADQAAEKAFATIDPATCKTGAQREAERIRRDKELIVRSDRWGCAAYAYGMATFALLLRLTVLLRHGHILFWHAACIFLAACVPLVLLATRAHRIAKQLPRCPDLDPYDY